MGLRQSELKQLSTLRRVVFLCVQVNTPISNLGWSKQRRRLARTKTRTVLLAQFLVTDGVVRPSLP